MENINYVISELLRNKIIFQNLLENLPEELFKWKQSAEKWNLLEIVCHLYDEEREDFRARVKAALENPDAPLSPIDPQGWVASRDYQARDYNDMISRFLAERDDSVLYLKGLHEPPWGNAVNHPKRGKISAESFLVNWLAHDYLHVRQILKLKYDYNKKVSDDDLAYAGGW